MAWSTSDTVAFITLIIAIPTSIAGVWTLHLHLQARQARQVRRQHLFSTVSDDPSTETGIPLLSQTSPPSRTPTFPPPTSPTPTSTPIPSLHLSPSASVRPLPSSSTTGTPPSYPETHTRNNSMRYDSFFCRLHVNDIGAQPLPPIYTDPRPVQEV
ncbi:hypothetical protein ASPCAL05831 [Aspergillus calidoustus]|uniref:Uncharacterized protein n=1 Tax=Aspergillus calidoustus TaxID=454130 RepID=A0A0U5FYH7_ASPCI|nr:hypothetical protein ASPCAL05831 [Aspergillus calidoustus]